MAEGVAWKFAPRPAEILELAEAAVDVLFEQAELVIAGLQPAEHPGRVSTERSHQSTFDVAFTLLLRL